MKKFLNVMLVLTIFILAKQVSPTAKVYYTPEGTETTEQNRAMTFDSLKEAYGTQIKIGNDWEIVAIQ